MFFTDATNGCYHTAGDGIEIVDFGKLARQAEIGFRVVQALAESPERPTYTPVGALDTYDDLLALSDLLTRTLADLPHVTPDHQDTLLYYEDLARTRVAGRAGRIPGHRRAHHRAGCDRDRVERLPLRSAAAAGAGRRAVRRRSVARDRSYQGSNAAPR